MSWITIKHLAVTGPDIEPAVLHFGEDLTVIHGASDTGKSFVFDAINFMLGAKSLRHIVELDPYRRVLLGIKLANGSEWTLARNTRGGAITRHSGLHEIEPAEPGTILAEKHNSESDLNLSAWLLKCSNVGQRRVRKNNRGETVGLSFREVARICLVDEIDALSKDSPAESGQFVTKTKERSAFRLLLEDEDDAQLSASGPRDEARATKAQIEGLSRLLATLLQTVGSGPPRPLLESQVGRLDASVQRASAGLESSSAELRNLEQERSRLSALVTQAQEEASETTALRNRFGLLLEAYESDLKRLDAVEEAGSLLSFFGDDTCPHCGAPSTAWGHTDMEVSSLQLLVEQERSKIAALRDQLAVTLEDMDARADEEEEARKTVVEQLSALQAQIQDHVVVTQPVSAELGLLLEERSRVQRTLNHWEQIDEIVAFKDQLETELPEPSPVASSTTSMESLPEFEAVIRSLLQEWTVSETSLVRFDPETYDLVVGERPRAERGAGMRALLHAAFTIGFAEYCLANERPHPGFVILDSPLVTYRDPDADNEPVSGQVSDAFYRYLGNKFSGQAIIIENTAPPSRNLGSSVVHVFTHSTENGRFGFFPAQESAN